jgi:hypothetical protein
VLHMLQSAAARTSDEGICAISCTGCWTRRSAALEKLSQVSGDLSPCAGPILPYRVSQFANVALDFEFVLFEPGDIELLARCTSLKLPSDVLFIVADNPDMMQSIPTSLGIDMPFISKLTL